MFSVRPVESPHYLARPRLLDQLPDQAGYVVWLEAPYGYGKSILASQWAAELEERGWRIVWASLAGREVRSALAARLELPASAPWGVVLDVLWNTPTLLVMEELDGDEELSPLLKELGGLVLLASRQHLPYPALAQLQTAGRLTHLGAAELAFTASEAAALFEGGASAEPAWRTTRGWPLPLHFSAISGALPLRSTLIEGVRSSVDDAVWRELLFMAALDQLPTAAASDATRELARVGFVQELSGTFRLHPLAAEGVLDAYGEEVRAELNVGADRLSPAERGAAFERAGHLTALAELLEGDEGRLYVNLPDAYVRWHEQAPGKESLARRTRVAIAQFLLTRFDEVLPAAARLVEDPGVGPEMRVRLATTAVFALATAKRFDRCEWFAGHLRANMAAADPILRCQALQNLGTFAFMRGDLPETERLWTEGLEAIAEAEPGPVRDASEGSLRGNLMLLGWELHGHVEEPLAVQLELIGKQGSNTNWRDIVRQNAAVNLGLLGRLEEAKEQLRLALAGSARHAHVMMETMIAFFDLDTDAFPRLLAAARRWELYELCERVSALWLRALCRAGKPDEAVALEHEVEDGPYTRLQLAWALADIDPDRALELLEETRGAYHYRDFRLHWLATAYLLNRSEEDLDELLALTRIRERVLPYAGLPLGSLPRHRPVLARAYPLKDVLESGWQEAIQLRLHEVPHLELRLLGEMSAVLMGEEVPLTDRQQQLLALLALGYDREKAAEALWPETDEARQRNNMGVQLNLLRKALEPWGTPKFLHKEGLRDTNVDLEDLEKAIREGDYRRVLETYREPLCGGLRLEAVQEVERQLREEVVTCLYTAAGSADDDGAIRCLRSVLELEPLHEEAMRLLIVRLNARGRGLEARRAYERFSRQLHDELGLAPRPETTALLAQA